MKDNYSWLDSCFKLIKGNYEHKGGQNGNK